MMHAGFSAGTLPFHTPFFALHMLGMFAVSIGVILLLIWAFKHLSEHKLWKWGWILVIGGIILCILTAMTMFGGNGYWNRSGDRFYKTMPMMQQQAYDESDATAQAEEEAKGKALYDKLEAKQTTCADLSDDEFELIGEYVMGTRAGDAHEQMNAMMKRMMGEKGEEQMHIVLGRSSTGCDSEAQPTGMMRGMMQRTSSSAR